MTIRAIGVKGRNRLRLACRGVSFPRFDEPAYRGKMACPVYRKPA